MADRAPLVAVLAAGQGTRFGGAKLDADCAGKPLGQWALDAVIEAGFAPGLIVTGPDAPAFAVAAGDWQLLANSRAGEGQGTSVALAAQAACERGDDLLILLADMPLIAPDHLRQLAAAGDLSATRHADGAAGVPIFVPHAYLSPFAALSGDRGAGPVLRRHPGLRLIPAPLTTLSDADTPEDLAAIAATLAAIGAGTTSLCPK